LLTQTPSRVSFLGGGIRSEGKKEKRKEREKREVLSMEKRTEMKPKSSFDK
jgi:hypothetical protein